MSHGTKLTWYRYDYQVPVEVSWEEVIDLPDVLTIACMKAFAIGQRAKWKDYVDMYFILREHSLKEVSKRTVELFGEGLFDEALLRGQLSYFKDVDYREKVKYMPGFEMEDREIKEKLTEIASKE